jgi:hypothetical protein
MPYLRVRVCGLLCGREMGSLAIGAFISTLFSPLVTVHELPTDSGSASPPVKIKKPDRITLVISRPSIFVDEIRFALLVIPASTL